jgi:splicing factor 3B subunit 1
MVILIREFQSPDEEMKKIVLKVVKQCCGTDGVDAAYIKAEILPHFFKHFWNQRMALDRRNYRELVDTTVELANKVGAREIVARLVDDLKDDSEQYRKMVMETLDLVRSLLATHALYPSIPLAPASGPTCGSLVCGWSVCVCLAVQTLTNLGADDVDQGLEERIMDGIIYAFQEQVMEDRVMLNGFGSVVNAFGTRVKGYLPQICGTILWRLNNKMAKVRQQAADLVSRIAVVMKKCDEDKLLNQLGVVLYEYLGEEYPEVLGSILGGLKAITNVVGTDPCRAARRVCAVGWDGIDGVSGGPCVHSQAWSGCSRRSKTCCRGSRPF